MIINNLEVIKTELNCNFIEFSVAAEEENDTSDDYNFEIFWSNDPVSGFEAIKDEDGEIVVIDGAIGPLSYLHRRIQFNFNLDFYYKVKGYHKVTPGLEVNSSIVYIGSTKDGIHESMKYAEELLYTHYVGTPCIVIKRKSYGTRCPECWNEERHQRIRSHCDTCNDTGFIYGYYKPIRIQIQIDSDSRIAEVILSGENNLLPKRSRMSNYPLVRPHDLVIDTLTNRRYRVRVVDTTKIPLQSQFDHQVSSYNYVVSQLLTLDELSPTSQEYNLIPSDLENIEITDETTPDQLRHHPPVTIEEGSPLAIDIVQDEDQILKFLFDDDVFDLNDNGELTFDDSIFESNYIEVDAGVDIIALNLAIYIDNNGAAQIASSSDITCLDRVVGFNINTCSQNESLKVKYKGTIVNESWSLTPGKDIFLDEDGTFTQTFSLDKIVMQKLGKAVDLSKIIVEIEKAVTTEE